MFFALMVFLCGGLGAMTRFFLDKAMSPRLRTESSIISPVEALTARSEGKMVKFLMLWLVQVVGAMVAALAGALLFVLLFGRYIAPVFPPDVLY